MANKIKYLAALAFPLAFALPVKAKDLTQKFELESMNAKSIESFFSSEDAPKISMPTYEIQEKSKITKNKYHADLCIGDLFENERFSVRYNNFNNGLKIGYFYHRDKLNGPETEGGIGIKMSSTTFESDGIKPLGYRKFETRPRIDTIATWEFSINKRYDLNGKKNCVNMHIVLTEDKKISFGDYLPGKPKLN